MSFGDQLDRLDEAVMEHLADTQSATYFPEVGDPVPDVAVIIDRDVAPAQAGQPTTTVERRTELTAHHDVLGLARRGETVDAQGETWRLVTKDRDDGHLATWIVTQVLS